MWSGKDPAPKRRGPGCDDRAPNPSNPREHRVRRRTLSTGPVRTVAITGGTHGNETNGVYLAKYFIANPEVVKRPSFDTVVMLSNPAAVKANQRYVETDMNRCFLMKDLSEPYENTALEQRQAREVDAALGPKGATDPKADLCIDLHNTTANTGVGAMWLS